MHFKATKVLLLQSSIAFGFYLTKYKYWNKYCTYYSNLLHSKTSLSPREPYHQDLSWSKLQVELDLDIAKEWVSGQLPLFILEIYLVKLGAPWRPIFACFVPCTPDP